MYTIKNQKGEFYTVQFNKMTFTKNSNFAYQFTIKEVEEMKQYLSKHFTEMKLKISK